MPRIGFTQSVAEELLIESVRFLEHFSLIEQRQVKLLRRPSYRRDSIGRCCTRSLRPLAQEQVPGSQKDTSYE